MRNTLYLVMVSSLAIVLSACACDPPDTVPFVDIARYMGKWYEIAKYPVFFEQGLVGVSAEYTLLDDGTVRVVNRGFRETFDGTEARIEGKATVADPTTNAKLTVQFGLIPLGFLGPNYWIIELGENYEYAVVSDRCKSTLWIFSRTPQMEPEVYEAIVSRLHTRGFDVERLELMPQPDASQGE
ncbi:MAG TPA: lipocalin family protein [Candidatus Hydrogenedentes bacterium]|nr:lipocalin family protein [Candidatus Hydrogenedentota bacterium]HOL75863.1 lipocalin family protein [Candidatus Hydrogenedentota bacterium]HPO86364.1 lipocalin family protein [Candidatus Hydrogenedentota bacterium]